MKIEDVRTHAVVPRGAPATNGSSKHSRSLLARWLLNLALGAGVSLLVAGLAVLAAECGSSGNTFWSFTAVTAPTQAAVAGTNIYMSAGSRMSIVDQTTGLETRSNIFPGVTLGRPVVARLRGGARDTVIVAGSTGYAYGLDAATLVTNWTRSTVRGSCASDSISAAPVIQLWENSDASFRAARTNDIVMVGTHYACGTTAANRVYGLDAGSGAVLWMFNATGSSQIDAVNGLALDYSRNTVYVASYKTGVSAQHTVWALNTMTGAKRWSVDLSAVEAEPVSANGGVYVGIRSGTLYKLNPDTGSTIWSRSVTASALITRVAVDAASGYVYVVDSGGTLHALQDTCSSVSSLWDFKPGSANVTAAPAIFGNQYLYVASDDGKVWQVRATDGVGVATTTISSPASAGDPIVFHDPGSLFPNRLLARSGTTVSKICIPWPRTLGGNGPVPVLSCSDCGAPTNGLSISGDLGSTLSGPNQAVTRSLTLSVTNFYPFQCATLHGVMPSGIGVAAITSTNGTASRDTNSFLAQANFGLPITISLTVTSSIPGTYISTVTVANAWSPHATIYLTNHVTAPSLSVSDAQVFEGDAGTVNMAFGVSLSAPDVSPVTVAFATSNGTALTGSDYTATNGLLVFAPGETNKTVLVTVFGDTDVEPDENFTLQLSNPTNAVISQANATGTILSDDSQRPPVVAMLIPDQTTAYASVAAYTFPAGTFFDPNAGQTLSYIASGFPPGVVFDGPARTFSGTPTNAGLYTVTVTATDDGTPSLSTNTVFNFLVAPVLLTVTADNANRAYGQPNSTFTGTLLGVVNGDNLTATFTSVANEFSPPGDYAITPVLQDPDSRLGNYIVTTNLGTLTVTGCADQLTVTSVADAGPGSLRQAILDANANTCASNVLISFNIPGAGVQTIALLTTLPTIIRTVTIDGYTQPGTSPNTLANADNAVLLIELSGANLGPAYGLWLTANGCTVRGLVINRFAEGAGILVQALANVIEGNFLGTDVTGTNVLLNFNGIVISGGAGNRIGGLVPASRNVAVGNSSGIQMDSSMSNQVLGNFIGMAADGLTAVPNSFGIYLGNCFQNQIGGSSPGARNVMSGATVVCGVYGGGNNVIQGNFIGTDASGTRRRGAVYGVYLAGATNNLIGGSIAGAGNLISGNGIGVVATGAGANYNVVAGNLIGTDVTGTNALANDTGILIGSGFGNRIGGLIPAARNIISGNVYGISLQTSGTEIFGNYVGLGADGLTVVSNQYGIFLHASFQNRVGGATPGARNVISGNLVGFYANTGGSNVIQGNFIGTDASGILPRGNLQGIAFNESSHNLVGGANPGEGNLVAAYSSQGVTLAGLYSSSNVVAGNLIGTDVAGTNVLGNGNYGVFINGGSGNVIGGTDPGARNVISGNTYQGVAIYYAPATGNVVQGNFIGTDITGTLALSNQSSGILVYGAPGNQIGGTTPGAGNVIAFSTYAGVATTEDGATNNTVFGNRIFAVGGPGIDLASDGVTPNDPGDADGSPNHFQNSPELASAILVAGDLLVRYRVDSAPDNSAYPLTVEFFLADVGGSGKTFISRHTYATPQTLTNITFTPAAAVNEGNPIVATATDANGNTSEFSAATNALVNRPPMVANAIPNQGALYGSTFNYAFAPNTFSDPDAGQTLMYTASNLPPNIAFDGPTRAFSGTNTNVGTYVVTVTATDNGSPPLSTNATFQIVVGKAPLTVTANNTNRLSGQANPAFSGLLTGVVPGDNITATFSTTATPSSPPGSYPITPVLLDPNGKLANYIVTTNLGTLTVLSSGSIAGAGPLNTARAAHSATLLGNGKVLVTGGIDLAVGYAVTSELYEPATGTWTAISPLLTQRYAHTATLLPNGKVLVAGGDAFNASAELYDPVSGTWTTAGMLNSGRYYHTATLLPNGKVLVVGGSNPGGVLSSGEVYDPATGTWTVTGSLSIARDSHTATLLPNGKVLVAGGVDSNFNPIASGEVYDPATGTWAVTGSLNIARGSHTATLLPNGKVLVAGGYDSNFNPIASGEVYEPATGTWTATGPLVVARNAHVATLLPNGKVLVAGGGTNVTVELYDPATGTWAVAGAQATGRFQLTATSLPNGKVLIAGGYSAAANAAVPDVDLYDSDFGTWAATSALNTTRGLHTTTLLSNGKVLVAGGRGFPNPTITELYDPVTGMWAGSGALNVGRAHHTATLLFSGRVLVVGGGDSSDIALSSVELYDPVTGIWTATSALTTERNYHTATLLPNGKVLVAAGRSFGGLPHSSAEMYDPSTETWTVTGTLNTARREHTATLLPNGKVLVAGGIGTSGALTSAELYDPATGTWTPINAMNAARFEHTATLLPNGKVLVAGGRNSFASGGIISSAELYDPVSETWTAIPALNTARVQHTATLLPNGKVLIAGGLNDTGSPLNSVEVYDPATGIWTASGALSTPRQQHAATLLPNGKVLIAAGYSAFVGGFLASVELYDVGLGFNPSWQPQIATFTSPLNVGSSLVINGSQFRGISEASGGGTQSSPSDYPVVQLRSIESGQTLFLPATSWSTNSFASAPVSGLPPGWTLVTVFVNGIPSASSFLRLDPVAVPTTILLAESTKLPNGAFRFAFANTPGAIFTALSTTNLSLALSNWTVLGPVTEISPGHFQFTDLQATNFALRFYSIRSP